MKHTCRDGHDNCRACYPTRLDRFLMYCEDALDQSRFVQWLIIALIQAPFAALLVMGLGWGLLSFFTWTWASWNWFYWRGLTCGIIAIAAIIKFFQALD